MNIEKLEETVAAPEGVTVTVDKNVVSVKGPKGELVRELPSKKVCISVKDNEITFTASNASKREKTLLFTFRSLVRNMFKGVTEGHEYKLKICSGHFPMNVSIKGQDFEIKNFIGEAVPRRIKIKDGVDVKIDGNIITVTGIDKGVTSQVAASIENLTKRPGFDTRIFQDGIYVTSKDGKEL